MIYQQNLNQQMIFLILLLARLVSATLLLVSEQQIKIPPHSYLYTGAKGDIFEFTCSYQISADFNMYLYEQGSQVLTDFSNAIASTVEVFGIGSKSLEYNMLVDGRIILTVVASSSNTQAYTLSITKNGEQLQQYTDKITPFSLSFISLEFQSGKYCSIELNAEIDSNFIESITLHSLQNDVDTIAVMFSNPEGSSMTKNILLQKPGAYRIKVNFIPSQITNVTFGKLIIYGLGDKFKFDDHTDLCLVQCDQFSNTVKSDPDSPNQCQCEQGYKWNQMVFQCSKLCYPLSQQIVLDFDQEVNENDICQCREGYISQEGEDNEFNCLIDCSMVENSTQERISSNQCECKEEYVWNSQNMQCVRTISEELSLMIGCIVLGSICFIFLIAFLFVILCYKPTLLTSENKEQNNEHISRVNHEEFPDPVNGNQQITSHVLVGHKKKENDVFLNEDDQGQENKKQSNQLEHLHNYDVVHAYKHNSSSNQNEQTQQNKDKTQEINQKQYSSQQRKQLILSSQYSEQKQFHRENEERVDHEEQVKDGKDNKSDKSDYKAEEQVSEDQEVQKQKNEEPEKQRSFMDEEEKIYENYLEQKRMQKESPNKNKKSQKKQSNQFDQFAEGGSREQS